MFQRLERLLAELKRRHVFRMAGVYALGAWVVIQVADTTFPYLGIPQWIVTVLIVAAAIGLPVTIALAWAFDLTPEGIRREDESSAHAVRPLWRRAVPILLLVLLGIVGFMTVRRVGGAHSAAMDENLAAVMPFRATSGDKNTAALGEGMVDLFALRLGGEQGMRAADPRATISRWHRNGGGDADDPSAVATATARSLGAARFITGNIVVNGNQVTIGARLTRTGSKNEGRPVSVTGALDSLLYLVDQLAVDLLARDAGLESQRLGGLTSLPALQAYLLGKSAHRRGEYQEAIRSFNAALQADSMFALAAVSLAISARRSPQGFHFFAPALDLAFRHRNRLSERDQAILHALNPVYPNSPTILQTIDAFEQMLAKWPNDADAWFEVGDLLIHYGRAQDIENSLARADRAFDRALEIDSTFYLPVEHLLLSAFDRHDVEQVRRLAPRFQQVGPTADRRDFVRWRIGLELGDSAAIGAISARLDSASENALGFIYGEAQWQGVRLDDAEKAVAVLRKRAGTVEETRQVLLREHHLALNRGQVRRAREILDRLPVDAASSDARNLSYIEDALFGDGDVAAANNTAARLEPRSAAPTAKPGPERSVQVQIQCELAWWDLARERVAPASARRDRMRTATLTLGDAPFNDDDRAYCLALIEAWTATIQGRTDAARLIDRADSINIYSSTSFWQEGNFITARLRERTGDRARALTTVRRVMIGASDIYYRYVSTTLRETARLALLQGDTALARDYYRRYLALRAEADPSLQADIASARAAFASISGEPRK